MFVGMGKLLNEVTLEGELKQSVEVLEGENTNTSCDGKDATVSSAASCENKQHADKVSASSSPITCDAKEAAAAATSDSTVSTASRLIYVFILHIRKCQNSSIDCDIRIATENSALTQITQYIRGLISTTALTLSVRGPIFISMVVQTYFSVERNN